MRRRMEWVGLVVVRAQRSVIALMGQQQQPEGDRGQMDGGIEGWRVGGMEGQIGRASCRERV